MTQEPKCPECDQAVESHWTYCRTCNFELVQEEEPAAEVVIYNIETEAPQAETTSHPPPPPIPDFRTRPSQVLGGLLGDHRMDETETERMLQKCKLLKDSNYDMYGLFGRPETGKSCFVYALGKNFKAGAPDFGGFTTEGSEWTSLTEDLEDQWSTGRRRGTARGYFVYLANQPKGGRHMSLMDIAGEHFEDVESWSDEIFDFFGAYLSSCKGFFLLLELDSAALDQGEGIGVTRKSRQMEHIISFLAVAATVHAKGYRKPKALRKAVAKTRKNMGKVKLNVPIAICLSKADRIPNINFGTAIGRVTPGDHTPMGDPWNVLKTLWPKHVESLMHLAPKLKVEWLSCLGMDFERAQKYSGSLGLGSVFNHVVVNPPPNWAMTFQEYEKWRHRIRKLGLGGKS